MGFILSKTIGEDMDRPDLLKTPQWEVRLRAMYGKLGMTEQRVADFLKMNTSRILDISIAEIADEAKVSESTVVRFCRHLGYKGLKEFKIYFAQERNRTSQAIDGDIGFNDTLKDLKSKIFQGSINALQDSLETLDEVELERAVEVLHHARNIDIYSIGGSTPIANYTRHQFMKIGVRTNVYNDKDSQRLSISQLSKDDVLIAISCSGETREIVESMENAHEQGATIICITNSPNSHLARISDIRLINTGARFFRDDMNAYSRQAQLATVNILFAGVALCKGKKEYGDEK
jgi:DNA-binding MurR/RpiR family transcriptional regulator